MLIRQGLCPSLLSAALLINWIHVLHVTSLSHFIICDKSIIVRELHSMHILVIRREMYTAQHSRAPARCAEVKHIMIFGEEAGRYFQTI